MAKFKGGTLAYGGLGLVFVMSYLGLFAPAKFWEGDRFKELFTDPITMIKLQPFGLDGAWVLFIFAIVLAAVCVWTARKFEALAATVFAFWIFALATLSWLKSEIDYVRDFEFDFDALYLPTFAHFLMLVGFVLAFWGLSKLPGKISNK